MYTRLLQTKWPHRFIDNWLINGSTVYLYKNIEYTTDMKIKSQKYGKIQKEGVAMLFECDNERGLRMQCTNYESSLLSVQVNLNNIQQSITGTWDMSLANAVRMQPAPGATLGRIGYSIPSGVPFTIGKREYTIAPQSEFKTWQKKIWNGTLFGTPDACGMRTQLISAEGDQELPGEVALTTCYTITNQNELYIEHLGQPNKKCPLSLATYLKWNLSDGYGVLEHDAVIYASQVSSVPSLASLQPTKKLDLDFQRRRSLCSHLNHYFALGSNIAERYHPLANPPRKLKAALWLYDPKSRRYMELFTNYPMLQVAITRTKLGSDSSLLIKPCIPYDSPNFISSRRDRYHYTSVYRFGVLQ